MRSQLKRVPGVKEIAGRLLQRFDDLASARMKVMVRYVIDAVLAVRQLIQLLKILWHLQI